LKRVYRQTQSENFASDYERYLGAVYAQFKESKPEVFFDGVKDPARVKAFLSAGERVDGIVHVVRKPVDYVMSSLSADGTSGYPAMIEAATAWRRAHRYCKVAGRSTHYLRITYEDLCNDVDRTLAKVFSFAGIKPRTVAELQGHAVQPWHFIGNISMLAFNWNIEPRKHKASRVERFVIGAAARSKVAEYTLKSVHARLAARLVQTALHTAPRQFAQDLPESPLSESADNSP
jgi:hypothetical protein